MNFSRLLQSQFLPMLEKAPIPFCIVSSDARPVYVNQAASRLLLSQRHKEGDPLELHGFFHECTGKTFSLEKELRRILLAGNNESITGLAIKTDAASRPISMHVMPIPSLEEAPAGAILILEDSSTTNELNKQSEDLSEEISRLKREIVESRRRLKLVSRRLLDIQESERRHIARELHDEVGQALTALKIQLQTIQKDLSLPAMTEKMRAGIGLLDRLMDQVRNLSLDLRPSLLDDLGLKAALRWYTDRIRKDTGLEITIKINISEEGLGPELDMVCFRIVQEALTNVARHAKADRVKIEIEADGSRVRLTVADDGNGFDLKEARRAAFAGKSLGLIGMMERVNLVGGVIDIDSSPGKGVRIEVVAPLSSADMQGWPKDTEK